MDYLSMARQKALELMGGVKQPSMGEVRQGEFDQGLGVQQTNEPQYSSPEDKDYADMMRDSKRKALVGGMNPDLADYTSYKGNWPNQEDIDKNRMAMEAGMGSGSLTRVGTGVKLAEESMPLLGSVIKKFPGKEEVMAQINNLRKNMTPENIEKIKELSQQLYGKVMVR